MSNAFKKILLLVVITILVTVSQVAYAYNFTLNRAEFNTWNERCKALYISTTVGFQSEFQKDLPSSIISKYRKADRLGEWHYCAGLIYLQRARSISSDVDKKKVLKIARSEMIFSIKKAGSMPVKSMEMRTELAKVHYYMGEKSKAFQYLNTAVANYPNHTPIYLALAELNYDNKSSVKAVEKIVSAPEKVLSSSAELNYFVGLHYYKTGKIKLAKDYARTAYELGYPFPWLKNKLKL